MAFLKFILFLACAACVVARQRSSKDSNKTPVGSTITSSLLHSILASADKKVAPNADDLDNPTVISLNIELTEIEKDVSTFHNYRIMCANKLFFRPYKSKHSDRWDKDLLG